MRTEMSHLICRKWIKIQKDLSVGVRIMANKREKIYHYSTKVKSK
jgi:hypothetical protein